MPITEVNNYLLASAKSPKAGVNCGVSLRAEDSGGTLRARLLTEQSGESGTVLAEVGQGKAASAVQVIGAGGASSFLQIASTLTLNRKVAFGETTCVFDGENKMSMPATVFHELPGEPIWADGSVFAVGTWAGKSHPWSVTVTPTGIGKLAVRAYPIDAGPYALNNQVNVHWAAIG